jgi:hypothetical protein
MTQTTSPTFVMLQENAAECVSPTVTYLVKVKKDEWKFSRKSIHHLVSLTGAVVLLNELENFYQDAV